MSYVEDCVLVGGTGVSASDFWILVGFGVVMYLFGCAAGFVAGRFE